MRIISKFKDYYDIGLGLGVDQSLIFKRESVDLFESDNSRVCSRMDKAIEFEYYVVGFCGKFYPHVAIKEGKREVEVDKRRHKTYYAYKYALESYSRYFDLDSTMKKLDSVGYKSPKRSSFAYSYSDIRTIENHFTRHFRELDSIWVDNHTPIFLTRIAKLWSWIDEIFYFTTINPKLSDIEFYKVIDPYTAFQEISMFLGGVLGSSGNPIPEVSERDRFEGKGHDFKKSFRKAPGKKKKRRDSNG